MGNEEVKPLAVSLYDAAIALSVSPNTIRNLINDGTLKTFRIGDRRLIPVSELHRLVGEAK